MQRHLDQLSWLWHWLVLGSSDITFFPGSIRPSLSSSSQARARPGSAGPSPGPVPGDGRLRRAAALGSLGCLCCHNFAAGILFCFSPLFFFFFF